MTLSHKSKAKYAQIERQEARQQKTQNEVKKALEEFLKGEDLTHINSSNTLYSKVYAFIDKKARNLLWKERAYAFLLSHIKELNTKRETPLPLPEVILNIHRSEPVFSLEWIEHGTWISQIHEALLEYWERNSRFSHEEVIANLLMSSILYGGLNQDATLTALLQHLIEPQPVQNIAGFTLIFLTPISEKYGNVILNDDHLGKSRDFIPDQMTRLWLFHFYHKKIKVTSLKVQYYLNIVFKKMNINFNPQTYKRLLRYAHFNWIQLSKVDIDPALMHCLTEKIQTCGLSEIEFERFYQPKFKQNLDQIEYKMADINDDLRTNQVSTFDSLEAKILKLKKIHKDLLKIISTVKTDQLIVDLIIHYCLENQSNFNEYTQRLVLWLISLYKPSLEQILPLADPFNCCAEAICRSYKNYGPLKDSSIYSYYTLIGEPWLIHCLEYENADADIDSTLKLIYEQMIANRADNETRKNSQDQMDSVDVTSTRAQEKPDLANKNNAPFIKMLARFHRFQQEVFNAEDIDLGPIHQYTKPRARLIGPKTYQVLMKKLQHLSQSNASTAHHYLSLQLIYALAYRTGMRINEILALRLRDVEGLEYLSIWVQPYGSKKQGNLHLLKTDSAERRLPIYCLLNHDEKSLLQSYVVQQRLSHQPNNYLFHPWNSTARFSSHHVTTPFKLLMNEFFDDHNYSFHSFRHTAANNLALLLICDDLNIVQELTELPVEKILDIRQHLSRNAMGQDKWFHIAHLLGHIEPTESFRSYLHLAYFLGGCALFAHEPHLKISLVKKIMGLDQQTNLIANKADHLSFNFNQYTDLINATISAQHPYWLQSDVKRMLKKFQNEKNKAHDYFQYFAGTIESKITFSLFYEALKLLEQYNDPHIVAGQLNLPEPVVNYWYNNALELSKLTSREGTLRLFKAKPGNNRLIKPPVLEKAADKEVLEYFFKQIQIEFQKSPENIEFVLNAFLSRVNFSKTGIHYPWSQVSQLEKFYKYAYPLFPANLWLISGKNAQMHLDGLSTKETLLLAKLAPRNHQMQLNTSQDHARLHLYSVQHKKSLVAFRFCLHMACIGRPLSIQLTVLPESS